MERPLETCDSQDDFTLNVVNKLLPIINARWFCGTFFYIDMACADCNLITDHAILF